MKKFSNNLLKNYTENISEEEIITAEVKVEATTEKIDFTDKEKDVMTI